MDDGACDFPRIDDRRTGLKSDFGYSMQIETDVDSLTFGNHLYNYELESGSRIDHKLGTNVAGGEPVFAPSSSDAGEDEGWVLSFVHERETRKSKMIIIDSRNFESDPVAEVYLPQRIPYGAHGSWMPNK